MLTVHAGKLSEQFTNNQLIMYNPILLTETEARSLANLLDGEWVKPSDPNSPVLTLVQKLETELDVVISWKN